MPHLTRNLIVIIIIVKSIKCIAHRTSGRTRSSRDSPRSCWKRSLSDRQSVVGARAAGTTPTPGRRRAPRPSWTAWWAAWSGARWRAAWRTARRGTSRRARGRRRRRGDRWRRARRRTACARRAGSAAPTPATPTPPPPPRARAGRASCPQRLTSPTCCPASRRRPSPRSWRVIVIDPLPVTQFLNFFFYFNFSIMCNVSTFVKNFFFHKIFLPKNRKKNFFRKFFFQKIEKKIF